MFTCGATGVAYCSHVIILWWLGRRRKGREYPEARGDLSQHTAAVGLEVARAVSDPLQPRRPRRRRTAARTARRPRPKAV